MHERQTRGAVRELARRSVLLHPSEEIVALATGMPCYPIVLGAPMKRFFDGMVLSRTALRVIRHSPCPVLSLGSQPDPREAETVGGDRSHRAVPAERNVGAAIAHQFTGSTSGENLTN